MEPGAGATLAESLRRVLGAQLAPSFAPSSRPLALVQALPALGHLILTASIFAVSAPRILQTGLTAADAAHFCRKR